MYGYIHRVGKFKPIRRWGGGVGRDECCWLSVTDAYKILSVFNSVSGQTCVAFIIFCLCLVLCCVTKMNSSFASGASGSGGRKRSRLGLKKPNNSVLPSLTAMAFLSTFRPSQVI